MAFFAIAGLITSILSTAVSAYTAYEQGKTQKEIAKQDSRQVKLDAIAEEQETREAIRRQRIQNKREQGAIRARIADSGAAMEGTPLTLFSLNAARQELELQDVKRISDVRTSKAGRKAESLLYRGNQAYRGGVFSAGGSILSGTASAFSQIEDMG
jgi:hypothetical protein